MKTPLSPFYPTSFSALAPTDAPGAVALIQDAEGYFTVHKKIVSAEHPKGFWTVIATFQVNREDGYLLKEALANARLFAAAVGPTFNDQTGEP